MGMQNYATETRTCIEREVGSACRLNNTVFQYAVYREGNALYIVVNWRDSAVTKSIKSVLWVRIGEYFYYLVDKEGWDDPVLELPLTADMGAIYLTHRQSTDELYYQNTKRESILLHTGTHTVLPQVSFSPVISANHTHTFTWDITPGEDRVGRGTGAIFQYRIPAEPENPFTAVPVFAETMRSDCTLTTDGTVMGAEVRMVLEYRTYGPDWDGVDIEDFVTLNRYTTPVQLVARDAAIPLAPATVTASMPLAEGRLTVRWQPATDPLSVDAVYVLERSLVTGGAETGFVQLYRGSSLSFRDTLPVGIDGVRYRVRTVNVLGNDSLWTDTGVLAVVKSNLYVGMGGDWRRVSALWIGGKKASPLAKLGG